MRIILFGGTFDPPHLGHCQIAQKCLTICDKLILLPAKVSPYKDLNPIASDRDRVKMLQLMILGLNGNVIVDDYEVNSINTPSYTIDTIYYLSKKYIDSKLFLVLGEDQYANFSKWKSYNKIKEFVTIICIQRPGFDSIRGNDCIYIDDVDCKISSSLVRSKASVDIALIKNLVPTQILNYIKERKLYR